MTKFNKKLFLELLYATHNMGGNAEPEGDGIPTTEAALAAANALADIAQRSRHHLSGVLVAAKLLVEVASSDSPNDYMATEAMRAWDGIRHEEKGATIEVVCHKGD